MATSVGFTETVFGGRGIVHPLSSYSMTQSHAFRTAGVKPYSRLGSNFQTVMALFAANSIYPSGRILPTNVLRFVKEFEKSRNCLSIDSGNE